jgi:hypothetical protein
MILSPSHDHLNTARDLFILDVLEALVPSFTHLLTAHQSVRDHLDLHIIQASIARQEASCIWFRLRFARFTPWLSDLDALPSPPPSSKEGTDLASSFLYHP